MKLAFALMASVMLAGCVVAPIDGYYAQPAYVQPAPVYVAPAYFGFEYRGGYEHHRRWR
jgi:hypothetical protein